MKTNNASPNTTAIARRANRLTRFLIFSASLLFITCVPQPTTKPPTKPPTCSKGQLNFEAPDFVADSAYSATGVFYNDGNGLAVVLDSITWVSGLRGFNQSIVLTGASHPFGTNQILSFKRPLA